VIRVQFYLNPGIYEARTPSPLDSHLDAGGTEREVDAARSRVEIYAYAVLILHGDDRASAYECQICACRGIIAIEVRKLVKAVDLTPCRGVSDPNFAYRHSVNRDPMRAM